MLTLTIPGRLTVEVADFPAASAAYVEARDASGEGGSTFPIGKLVLGLAQWEVSFNGRIWLRSQLGTSQLIYCPTSAAVDQGRPDIFNAGRESVWGRKCENPHPVGSVEREVFALGVEAARAAYVRAAA